MKRTEVLKKHGPAGSLVMVLRRYALLGWVLFFALGAYTALYQLVQAGRPLPVLTFDNEGRLLGNIDYVNPMHRSDNDLLADSKYFLIHYLAANSATVYDDAAIALSMMSQDLRDRRIAQLKETNQLRMIEQADVTSRVTFDRKGDKLPVVAWRREGLAAVRLGGTVRIGDTISNPYFVELQVKLIPRTLKNAHGIEVVKIIDI